MNKLDTDSEPHTWNPLS